MNKVITIILLCLATGIACKANDTIYYKLPVAVEAKLYDRIQNYLLNSNDPAQILVFLGKSFSDEGDVEFDVDFTTYDHFNHRSLFTQIAENTHRYVKVKEDIFPLYLRDDELLGSPTPMELRGNIFNRDCSMIRQHTILEDPISFKLNGEITKK